MIRYVDSSGWTWAVCELADRLGTIATAVAGSSATVPATTGPLAVRSSDGRLHVASQLADAPASADADAPGELYFLSRLGTRKLREYPASWSQLSRDGLEALCAEAEDVGLRATAEGALA